MLALGVSVDLEKVEVLMSWERPNVNLRDTKFLGLAGYYRRFENGLKLSIRGRIIGFHLWDMDSMVGAVLTIERERLRILGTLGIQVLVARGRIIFLLVWGRGRRLLLHTSFRTRAWMSISDGIAPEIGIPRLWDNTVPVSRRT